MKPGIQVWGYSAHWHKKIGEMAQGVLSDAAKMCFFCHQYNDLSDTYPSPILTMFEITDVNQCVGEYIREKFLPPPHLPKKTATGSVILGRVLVTSVQTVPFQAIGIILGASQNPKDAPFVCEF